MNKYIHTLFRCLCLDLGYAVRPQLWDLHEFDSLKNELLELTESSYDDQIRFDNWSSKFGSVFGYTPSRSDIERPAVFRNIYQVLTFLLKLPHPVTNEIETKYIQSFLGTEAETRAWRVDRNNPITRLVRFLCRRTSMSLDLSPSKVMDSGRHGPGAVFNGEVGSDKNYFDHYIDSLHSKFPFDLYYANSSIAGDLSADQPRQVSRFVVSRLALVPKTFKGLRGVFISPKEAVFCQIGIDDCIKTWVKRSLWKDSWDPHSQTPSQELAYVGSYGKHYATLDLSDASDRIPLSLIAYVFHRRDYLALAVTRPSYVILPSGEKHRMAMLAPMGDGKTFAVLSIMSILISCASMMHRDGLVPQAITPLVIRSYASRIRVFGDDIIIPSEYYAAVCNGLKTHNLKVNIRKSFVNGNFREACGMDAYNGVQVTPLRCKFDMGPSDKPEKLIAFHNYCVRFYSHLRRTIASIRDHIRLRWKHIGFTTNSESSPNCLLVDRLELERYVSKNYPTGRKVRWNSSLQRFEQYCFSGTDDIVYPRSEDPRWDLSYSLFPKRPESVYKRVDTSFFQRTSVLGSYRQFIADQNRLGVAGCSLLNIRKPRARKRPEWQGIN